MRSFLMISLFALPALAAAGCKSAIDPGDGFLQISGIARTFENGTVTEDDPDDWQPRTPPSGTAPAAFDPAFPNPASESCSLRFSLAEQSTVRARVVDRTGATLITLVNSDMVAGNHTMSWDLVDAEGTPLPAGLYRVLYTVTTLGPGDTEQTVSHGDVEITR